MGSLRSVVSIVLPVWFGAVAVSPAQSPDWLVDPTPFRARVDVSSDVTSLTLTNGLVARRLRLSPAVATVAFDDLVAGASLLRAVQPEATVTIDGTEWRIGGLVGQPVRNFLTAEAEASLQADPHAFVCVAHGPCPVEEPFAWRPRREWLANPRAWPPHGIGYAFEYRAPQDGPAVTVRVVYELYDGIPVFGKRIELRNTGTTPLRIDSFAAELLAVVETGSTVGGDPDVGHRDHRALHVETDYAFGGAMEATADNPSVHWVPDPDYATQVHYERRTPCLLRCAPPLGPGVAVAPAAAWRSFRVFELVVAGDRERRGLARRRMYRTLAPWVEENPLIFHVRHADSASVRAAVDQAAEVGFELVLMTFGSGFDAEDDGPANVARLKELVDYAHGKGVALGGYSLLASRSIDAANDVVNPATGKPGGFARFGNSPCLGSEWGRSYFAKVRRLYEATGLDALEHDGSYPGDACASTSHPGHAGHADSQWTQWETIRDLYRWARGRGVYLNVPDWYFLSGANKTGMGYRETNWSLPRADQLLIERQNVYDGTWTKAVTMGWMFVPLSEYHGGGAAATIEPLDLHLDHYEARFANLLGAGVQACWRGPRLYDTDRVRDAVRRWTTWFRANRAILEADVVHGRRPDGRDVDWLLHVAPGTATPALLAVYNPLAAPVTRRIVVDVSLAGLSGTLRVGEGDATHPVSVDERGRVMLDVQVQGQGHRFVPFRR
ncbi:MAG: hypothetical protein JNK15_09345 [Planctomycetes bacterium]|nr:hypothetical protein [Planctomycetota bacterium]